MSPLDAREWLEAERLAGNPYAGDLIDLIDNEPAAIECGEAISEIRDLVPKEIRESPDLWRLVEWVGGQITLLGEIEDIIKQFSEGTEWPNGFEPINPAEKLEAMFLSSRWLEYDL